MTTKTERLLGSVEQPESMKAHVLDDEAVEKMVAEAEADAKKKEESK